MICKCPQCDGALEYNPGIEHMECRFCGNIFVPDEINEDSLECKVYTCTSCAGELVVNDVEMATFCPYCGQPTIVFSRVSKEVKPKYILPFSIDKQEAIKIAGEHFNKGIFVPKTVKKLTDEHLRGIYIPYYLVDIYYHDRQRLVGFEHNDLNNKKLKEKYFIREAECNFEKITCDASKQLNDESSQRLEPFKMKDLKEFNPVYLSGFYADMSDTDKSEIEKLAKKRAEELFDKDMVNSCTGARAVEILNKEPKVRVIKSEYALLPAWFLTFRYKNEPYTLLLNGQTGKLVGTIPFEKGKMISLFSLIFLGASLICTLLFYLMSQMKLQGFENLKGYLLIVGLFLVLAGMAAVYMNWGGVERTKNKKAERFVKERQEKS